MRVKGGTKTKNTRKKVLKQTKGFQGRIRNTRIAAMEALDRALAYNYRDRKQLKRNQRTLWITRLTAAARLRGFSYSSFIHALKKNKIEINRKILADLAATDPRSFDQVVKAAGLSA